MSTEDLERRVEDIVARLEKRIEDLEKSLDQRFSASGSPLPPLTPPHRRSRDNSFWGIALLVVGLILLANHFDWFYFEIPWIPAALIILGLYLILENR
ncbi:MAG: hypothetical protein C4524_14280 [Candidatus Zixiibacteriota bacterium]|nr:MAG: hypothetical protein C4524_14280 [candidate division Zixibacteria bacterium]